MTRIKKKSGFNRRIKRRMVQLGLSQTAVAEAMGWTQGQVSHLCVGRTSMIFADSIFRLAEVLKCDPKWLALGEEPKADEVGVTA
jgi:transcriptional regulator with XRE-family HTH domain